MTTLVDLSRVKETLKDEVHPKAVDFVFVLLHSYIDICVREGKQPTTAELVDDIPTTLMVVAGKLADVLVKESHLATYEQVGKVLDTMVEHRLFSYGPNDKLDDFKRSNTILQDLEPFFVEGSQVIHNIVENRVVTKAKALNIKQKRQFL